MRRVRLTTVAVEQQHVLPVLCMCSLSYPACNAHAPLSSLWPVRLCHIFPQYLITGMIFENKKLLNVKCVFIFSTPFVWNTSHSETDSVRYYNCAELFMYSSRYCCPILMKPEFPRQIFEKSQILKFTKICPVGADFSMRTGRQS
jgi:hypothetical protein